MSLPRPCEKCFRRFVPNSKSNKVCSGCRKKSYKEAAEKRRNRPNGPRYGIARKSKFSR